jgi:hypothetical protein
MNEEEDYKSMEAWAQAQLSRLPEKTAPDHLQQLVMLRLQEEARPSLLRTSWFQWSAGLKLASLSVTTGILSLVFFYSTRFQLEMPDSINQFTDMVESLGTTFTSIVTSAKDPMVIGNYQIGMAVISYSLILGIASLLVHQAKILNRNQS